MTDAERPVLRTAKEGLPVESEVGGKRYDDIKRVRGESGSRYRADKVGLR